MSNALPVVTPDELKLHFLHAQGLLRASGFGKGKLGALAAIRHLGYIQLDTLAVVARAHHHTLYTRTRGYREEHLAALVAEGKVFEYWSHAASFLPMEEYRFSLVRKQRYREGHHHWFVSEKKLLNYVLDRIRTEGPLQARDFETDRKRGSWFDWKPAKVALEQLFMEGTLMVRARQGFQKVYDLTERVLPEGVDATLPTESEYAQHLIATGLRAFGFATAAQLTYLRRAAAVPVQQELDRQVQEGVLFRFRVEGAKELHYAPAGSFDKRIVATPHFHLLSPFDNALIQRQRIRQLFNYDYQVECYVPEPKRKFGYFCLPMLWNGQFIGRLDPKVERASGVFHIKSLHLEQAPRELEAFFADLQQELAAFAAFNGCSTVVAAKTVPLKWRKLLG